MEENLISTYFLNYESKSIQDFIQNYLSGSTDLEKVLSLYYAVRDTIKYDPYHIDLRREELRSSRVVERKYGFCVEKAALLTTCVRSIGIPAKIGFANVRNHLTSARLHSLMKTDVFVFHGYSHIYLENQWVKATPAFNKSLCERTGTLPLEFTGKEDSIFHPLDSSGKKHMEYLEDFGSFSELPYERMLDEYEKHYSHLNVRKNLTFGHLRLKGNFEEEAVKSI
jgi:hypothetical protein